MLKKEEQMERLNKEQYHDSMRGYFAGELYNAMVDNDNIVVLTGDLGYGMLNKIRDDFPDRFVNCGASEQAMMGIATGMTYEGKIPVVYSITNFALYRPYEWLRNYIDHEQAPVKIVAAGRDKDYSHDGYTHHSEDAKRVLDGFENVVQMWPETKEDVVESIEDFITNGKPTFISLRR